MSLVIQKNQEETNVDDSQSVRGLFGWTAVGEKHIPYIFRASETYCSVRILFSHVLSSFKNLHDDINFCIKARAVHPTQDEVRLLNEINSYHCNHQFGRPFTELDFLIRISDAVEWYNYLRGCRNKLSNPNSKMDRCGFIRFNEKYVVAYVMKDNVRYVPIFYFDCPTELETRRLVGWDAAYLKFCCVIHGIKKQLFEGESITVASWSHILSFLPPPTKFEEDHRWPNSAVNLLLHNTRPHQTQPLGPHQQAIPATQSNGETLYLLNSRPLNPLVHPNVQVSTANSAFGDHSYVRPRTLLLNPVNLVQCPDANYSHPTSERGYLPEAQLHINGVIEQPKGKS